VPAEGDDGGFALYRQAVDFAALGPVARSVVELRFLHLATVFGLIPKRLAKILRLS
jgi:hypothetical protein